jgi:hypothetical protein
MRMPAVRVRRTFGVTGSFSIVNPTRFAMRSTALLKHFGYHSSYIRSMDFRTTPLLVCTQRIRPCAGFFQG